jgi:hypothetical protein
MANKDKHASLPKFGIKYIFLIFSCNWVFLLMVTFVTSGRLYCDSLVAKTFSVLSFRAADKKSSGFPNDVDTSLIYFVQRNLLLKDN